MKSSLLQILFAINGSKLKFKIHYFIVWTNVLMLSFNWGKPYRFFSYLNLLFVLTYSIDFLRKNKDFELKKLLVYIVIFPLGFIALHIMATGGFEYIKEVRKIVFATFLVLGIFFITRENPEYVKNKTFYYTLVLLFLYTAVQSIALFFLNRPLGIASNPHVLAFYSAAGFSIAVYFFIKSSIRLKFLAFFIAVLMGVFLLDSSSRPMWIGLMVASMSALIFLEQKVRLKVGLFIVVVLGVLTFGNISSFSSRLDELLINISTEERVVIWQDALRMQLDSTLFQWIVGHGLGAFESNFKLYSNYHLINIDFNSPHNFILDLIYSSGLIGFFFGILLILIIYKKIISGINSQNDFRSVYILIFVLITTNLISASITVQFFSTYNLGVIALVVGAIQSLNYFTQIERKNSKSLNAT